ncbi:hypothetical protein WN51_11840 [Melipona quadrifasciata]|uniref:Uncharacterized protein n=1 Tax=Melipona quadrifasciata TaxID=166423 RepID=A0A0M9A2T7_9HYME|nr:hypothetical protein WN51_11840 [Melipona quadrifasciata]
MISDAGRSEEGLKGMDDVVHPLLVETRKTFHEEILLVKESNVHSCNRVTVADNGLASKNCPVKIQGSKSAKKSENARTACNIHVRRGEDSEAEKKKVERVSARTRNHTRWWWPYKNSHRQDRLISEPKMSWPVGSFSQNLSMFDHNCCAMKKCRILLKSFEVVNIVHSIETISRFQFGTWFVKETHCDGILSIFISTAVFAERGFQWMQLGCDISILTEYFIGPMIPQLRVSNTDRHMPQVVARLASRSCQSPTLKKAKCGNTAKMRAPTSLAGSYDTSVWVCSVIILI